MEYQPITCVWEVTMGCNMRCGHCGSSCENALPGELTTEEALNLIDTLCKMKLEWVTLSGGEPLTRKDLPLLIKKFSSNGVAANIITNGWLIDEKMAHALKDANVSTVAISIDGTKDIHDSIRRPGAFEHAKKAFKILNDLGLTSGCVTTISNANIGILRELKNELIDMGVKLWQLQIGLPMGNFSKHPDWVILPEQLPEVIDFCYETSLEGKIPIYAADCLGYYNKKIDEVNQRFLKTDNPPLWQGCSAGVHNFGILHNGDITACTSIRDKKFTVGNIRERKLEDIWNDPSSFLWRRKLKKKMLTGDCKICKYGDLCLGGCTNTRLVMNKDIYSENVYCTFNLGIKRLRQKLSEITDENMLFKRAYNMVEKKFYQEASIILERVISINPKNIDALRLKGFSEYMCGNYELSELANRKALGININDYYATQGLGLALKELNKVPESIALLERAAKLTDYKNDDVINDLKFVYSSI